MPAIMSMNYNSRHSNQPEPVAIVKVVHYVALARARQAHAPEYPSINVDQIKSQQKYLHDDLVIAFPCVFGHWLKCGRYERLRVVEQANELNSQGRVC